MNATRRTFLKTAGSAPALAAPAAATPIDFRYAPLDGQAAYCFPDDTYKSLVGSRGDLRYGNPGRGKPIDYFTSIVEFTVQGMEQDRVRKQWLEDPRTPIIHTLLERPRLEIEIITFASNRGGEGRVDNVILLLRGKPGVRAVPVIKITGEKSLPVVASVNLNRRDVGRGQVLTAPTLEVPARLLFRFPQEGQKVETADPDALLAEARSYWKQWRAYGGSVNWKLPGRYQEFADASARNIQQAREIKDGRKTFQVGPTVYRGLWVVDGNFLLEAARYLGYDEEARQGLEATWAYQREDGGVFAAVTGPHWKDTGIAMFTLARQAELSRDWSYFRNMTPNLIRASKFLETVRGGKYGLLSPGFGDGGLGGVRPEFTNTIWALAGLRATVEAADKLGLPDFAPVKQFHDDLRRTCLDAAKQEMRRHPRGFEYLPMLLKEDPAWEAPDEWNRPKPQNAQWAMSQAIYPGLVFPKDSPIVEGHIALMQASTQEDVPIETGWLPHEGLWTYNAPFVSHVYLWAGLADWASRTFTGFLNHATPLYCWREEMPTRNSLVGAYIGDMPHNWASAECILFLRHMLALEDGQTLRLLAGITPRELTQPGSWTLEQTPTRFGRVDVNLSQTAGEWHLEFARGAGDPPKEVHVPARLAGQFAFGEAKGAKATPRGNSVVVEPGAAAWSCTWKG